ncbi:MAG: filamentous hemagglutinin N-terminal domain-containing protein, partial [Gammaproteobacteria bacterium]|nr:filamentous hemagglutinin N-terminal domain-containing protein [Gammaproteobacteria bacterium]
MNHVYRLVWNRTLNALVAAPEIAGSGGKASSSATRRSRRTLAPLIRAALCALGCTPAVAFALPTGGQVIAGQASLRQSGSALTITQSSAKAILNWQSFGIGSQQTVTFDQPNVDSIALNRVLGSDPSAIYGHLNANGQVFLVNPNGITFAPGAQVDVGGLVASTLNIGNAAFLAGDYIFSGTSHAAVINDGTVTAAPGGYVAFLGRQVINDGTLATPGGTTALGAGGTVSLTFAGNSLLHFQVSDATLNALAQNGGLIEANGGTVLLTADARDALLQTVVNNTGVIEAQTVQNHAGTIELLGGASGTTEVSGTLDAGNPAGGPGGTIETSGDHVQIGPATLDAGTGGQWLIDPVDLTIGTTAASAIDTALNNGTSVIEETTATGTSNTGSTNAGTTSTNGLGDIIVDAPISWSANGTSTSPVTLTLSAYHSLDINAAITATGSNDALVLTTDNNIGGTSSGGTLNIDAPVTLSGATPGLTINGTAYTVIQTMTQLQDMNSNLAGHYALGENLTDTNQATSFTPVGNGTTSFTGTFDGLGHTISDLTIDLSSANGVGLFGENA